MDSTKLHIYNHSTPQHGVITSPGPRPSSTQEPPNLDADALRSQRDDLVRRVLAVAAQAQRTPVAPNTTPAPVPDQALTSADVELALHIACAHVQPPTAFQGTTPQAGAPDASVAEAAVALGQGETNPPGIGAGHGSTGTDTASSPANKAQRIAALTLYNDTKDAAQMLIGLLAEQRCCRVVDVMRELDVADDD